MDSPILQTVIGLVFIFAVGAGLTSVVTESIGRYIGLRAEFLLRGLRTLLDGNGKFELPLWGTLFGTLRADSKQQQDAAKAAFAPLRTSVAPAAPPAPGEAVGGQLPAALAPAAQAGWAPAAQADSAASGKALVALVLAHPLVAATSRSDMTLPAGDAPLTNQQRRALPAYISGRTFSRVLIDLLVPDASDKTTLTEIMQGIDKIQNPQLKGALKSLATDINMEISTFRANIEKWYDDQMDRVSGWYKRYTRWISLVIGVILVLAFNFNVLTMAQRLFSDQAVAAAVVSEATQASNCQGSDAEECLRKLTGDISSARDGGLPIGWATVPACAPIGAGCTWLEERGLLVHKGTLGTQVLHVITLLIGWLLMVVALLPGANFWFDILGRLGTLRNTGPKPASS